MKGGDTDTNLCIAGAILGAFYGISDIPPQWINTVTMTNPRFYKYSEIDQHNINHKIEILNNFLSK